MMSFIIRDALEADIPACLTLESHYETDYVWQMSIQQDDGYSIVTFKTERLPRSMQVEYSASEERLHLALSPEHCFLIIETKDEEPEILAYLTMRSDPVHQRALVQDIVVSSPYRRNHIGTRLLTIATKWAMEHNLHTLTVETQTKNYPAVMFCQKAGLTFSGFNDHYFMNQDIAIFFSRTL